MTNRAHPKALPHSEIAEVFPDIFFVTGSVVMQGRVPVRFSRNMSILRENGELTLINSVRLTDAGLAELEKLGVVKHVIRLAGFHGMDDPFYKDRYGAKIWSVDAPYVSGFDLTGEPYFSPDVTINAATKLPFSAAKIIEITSSTPGEALLYLDKDGGILISGDSLQNWGKTDRYFSIPARIMMRLMGFIKPYNIGPGWLKLAKPDASEIKSILELEFDHVLPAHGMPVINQAKILYSPRLEAL